MINSLLPINGDVSIYRDCSIAIGNENQPVQVVLDVAKGFLTNAKLTCNAILKGKLTSLDPIVGENACQIRALVAICAHLDPDLKKEMVILSGKIQMLLTKVNHLNNKPPLSPEGLFNEQLEKIGLSLKVSKKVDYLLRSHFLTIGKYFYFNSNKKECSGIDCTNIKKQLENLHGA